MGVLRVAGKIAIMIAAYKATVFLLGFLIELLCIDSQLIEDMIATLVVNEDIIESILAGALFKRG